MCNRQSGISLFEGIVSLSIGAILLLMAAPLYVRMISDQQVSGFTSELVVQLQKARNTAVYQSAAVSLCSSDNGRACTQTPWSHGYIVFRDAGQAGAVDGDDRVLTVVTGRDQTLRVTLNGADHIQFQQNGGIVAGLTAPVNHALTAGPTTWASLLAALSPIAAAHASQSPDHNEFASNTQALGFLVCSGTTGRAVRLTAVGRFDTTKVACH